MTIEVKNSVKPIDYVGSINTLENRVNDVLLGKKRELLWILEHNTVYTGGTSSNKKDLINKNIKIIKTNRGGKYTLHSPGQKVVYFVLNLNKREKDIRKLISKVENCIINILSEYDVSAYADKKNIGIWVADKKIAAIGIRVKKWIAYHGFCLNVTNDLKKYKNIIPCGIKDKGITSLKDIGITDYKNINRIIAKHFLSIFS
ncbi:lipoyl(octanoyl) transferase LipB [Pelagibacteraceae bacterium]|nr:lipoyl(octanoyl) transferase LipB [Pelagibacteraceae bacterium]